ncbi:MAG: YbaB/EbfC family nucleoid-associated protein [Cytophagales bacterium]
MDNIQNFLKDLNLGAIEKKREEISKRLAKMSIEADAGGGAVRTSMDGNGKLLSLELKEELFQPENKDFLTSLVIASINKNQQKVAESTRNIAMENMMESLPNILNNLKG